MVSFISWHTRLKNLFISKSTIRYRLEVLVASEMKLYTDEDTHSVMLYLSQFNLDELYHIYYCFMC